MERRTLVMSVGTAVLTTVGGCLETRERDIDQQNTGNEANSSSKADTGTSKKEDGPRCSFHVELLENPPENAPVVSVREKQLTEVKVIERVFDKARDSERTTKRSMRRSGRYEQFAVIPDSDEEFEAAQTALEPLPEYDNSDYPPGVYLQKGNITAAIAEDCAT